MNLLKPRLLLIVLLSYFLAVQIVLAEEPPNEYECLHFNIGLLSLLETENTYFKRSQKQQYDENGPVAQALAMLIKRGESCVIKKNLYVEAAEYSLHFGRLADAMYFLQKTQLQVQHLKTN